MVDKGWQRKFDDPITLSLLEGRTLVTLRDAAQYITKLPKAARDSAEWRVAMEVLLLVAEHDGPEMMAEGAAQDWAKIDSSRAPEERQGLQDYHVKLACARQHASRPIDPFRAAAGFSRTVGTIAALSRFTPDDWEQV
jgi:hypothetical protein